MNVGPAFYILLVAFAGEPVYQWRVPGGWDSCMIMETMVKRYSDPQRPLHTECLSRFEWEERGRPGLMPSSTEPGGRQ